MREEGPANQPSRGSPRAQASLEPWRAKRPVLRALEAKTMIILACPESWHPLEAERSS